jgi:TPR repeat protein
MQESASRHYSALSPEEIKKQEEERSEIIRKRAEEGDAEAMYLIFDALSSNIKEPVAAWEWLCKAADQGYVKAQVEIAHWHRTTTWEFGQPDRLEWLREAGIHADDQIAYLWYTIAAREDDNRLRTRNNLFYGKLTEEGIIEAKDMVRNWKPGQCQRDLVTDTSKQ